jgi:Ca2+-binding EF-hand superfamily protein
MKNLFFHIDRRKTGRVDSEDLIELLNMLNGGDRIGEEGVNDLLGEMDFLRVGYLNYEDFVYLLLPK